KDQDILQREIFRRFNDNPDSSFLFLGFCNKSVPLSPSLDYWRKVCGLFARKLTHTPDLETLRHKVIVEISEDELIHLLASAPLMTGAEYLTRVVIDDVWQRLHAEFSREIEQTKESVEEFVQTYSPDIHLIGRVFFHLVESKKDDYPFAFLATYSPGLNRQGKTQHLPLRQALQEYGKDGKKLLDLLVTVQRAAKESALVEQLIESGELFHPLAWSAKEAYTFLREIPIYEQAGILCRIPDWWKRGASSLQVNISLGGRQPSTVGMDALLSFDIGLHLEGEPISYEEAKRIIDASEGLALIKNRWVAVDHEKLRQTLEAYETASSIARRGGLSFRDALRFELNPKSLLGLPTNDSSVVVTNGQWMESVLARMLHPEAIVPAQMDTSFKAKLRPYQQRGVAWLSFLHSLRFGMCLADDMGLGKTVQVLALLRSLKSNGEKGASLLVVPASLLSNWAAEIGKFTPELTFAIAHPSGKDETGETPKEKQDIDRLDLVITTYSLVQKYELLQTYEWKYVILDEAQAIKNPMTKQSRAVKKLIAANRIVMTGTPVENRLSDLWSIFDFINPGLLGSSQEFSRFAKNLNKDPEGYARLRKVIGPYILRRLKTDKSVISDLPEKVEMKTWSYLGKKQAILYQKLVDDLRRSVETAEGIQRKGIILSSLMKFKQICNHPDQYLGTGTFDEKESGKFNRLREICETIYAKRERVLIFTQFREMTEPLAGFLRTLFGHEGLVLHGGTPVGERKEIVAKFQDEEYVPFIVLSLKAGGVGLNLTAANHVVHFDRWWNPAVENQATDRAFRIGQKKNVVVHKFITKGTVEEKIDQMIEEKMKLSNDVVQAGSEAWITEMDNDELMKMFTLTL
ncbi:MAG TPA: DEAD/DEAH box helicase, partial [Nitrospirota bacterium]|nr:DEAD/DEAH box helicase [Nitrospirota bacterium]